MNKVMVLLAFCFPFLYANAEPVSLKCSGTVTKEKDEISRAQKETYKSIISIVFDRDKMTADIHGDWGCREVGLAENFCSGKFPLFQWDKNGEFELTFSKKGPKIENSTSIRINAVTGVFLGQNLVSMYDNNDALVSLRFFTANMVCEKASAMF